MADRAKNIMNDLRSQARARESKATAEKPDDPIYSLIANVGAMNKTVRLTLVSCHPLFVFLGLINDLQGDEQHPIKMI